MKTKRLIILTFLAFFLVIAPRASGAGDIDWSKADPSSVLLIYPGVASWDFLTSDDHRLGGKSIQRMKKDCRHCHLSNGGELDLKADEIAAGSIKMKRSHKPFEPEPIPGRRGVMNASIRAAYDSRYLYVLVEWPSAGAGWRTGTAGQGAPDRVSLQMNEGNEPFAKYGCFITCHNDLRGMPESPSKEEVRAEPYYGELGRDDVRLYAYYARNSWKSQKDQAALKKARSSGGLIDLVSIEIDEGKAQPHDGWVFDDRRWEKDTSLEASASWTPNRYTAVFKKRLKGDGTHDLDLKEGDVFSVGVAIHDGGAEKRKHYVSFPFTVGLGSDADVTATRVSD